VAMAYASFFDSPFIGSALPFSESPGFLLWSSGNCVPIEKVRSSQLRFLDPWEGARW